MKMTSENNMLISIIETLKKSKNEDGIEQAIARTGEIFQCARIVLFDYHVYQDSFKKRYEWSERKQMQEDHFYKKVEKAVLDIKEEEQYNFLSNVTDEAYLRAALNIKEGEMVDGKTYYRYTIERDQEVKGVIIIEHEGEFLQHSIEELGLLLYVISEEYSAAKNIQNLQTQNRFLQTLYSKMQTGLVQCVMEDHALRMIWANDAAFQIYGCDRTWYEETYGNSMERFVFVEDWPLVKEQLISLQVGDEIKEFEHRYINYFGQLRWLRVNALKLETDQKEEVIQLIFADVTHSKRLETDLEHEKERYRIALDSSSDVIFEYDLVNDEYVSYGSFNNSEKPKSKPVVMEQFMRNLHAGKICDSEHISSYIDFLTGKNMENIEVREKYTENDRERHMWVAIEGRPIYEQGILVKIIGKKTNITEKKQKEKEALEVVQRDRLTKLYTRKVGEKLVREYLEEKDKEEIGSFLLIDLDNFQMINDTYGYTFGDAILEEVAEVIKAATRQNDISVRFGGDEFLILMKNTEPGRTAVYGKRIYEKICNLYAGEDENIKISCSVGMVSTEISEDYQTLFQCADSMLAYVKNHGKSDAVCYTPNSKAVAEMKGIMYMDNVGQLAEDDVHSKKDNEDIVAFAFSILEQTKDIRSAINLLLGKIGRQLSLNKISIIENDGNFLCNIITYEWVAKKEYHDSICKYNISQEELEYWQSCFDSEGLFVMEDELRGKFSNAVTLEENEPRKRNQFYSAIYEEGQFKGAVVFEHSDALYMWPKEMRTKLKEVSKIISTHITKANADIASKAKTEFLSRMSHEIRTPMNAIMGMTSIAQSVIGDDKKVAECLAKISTSTQYLLSLINDVLDMSRIESGSMSVCQEAFQLEKLVSEIVVLMSPQAENKHINLKVERSYSDIMLIGDELRLNQVLINIIGNALKFTPEYGTITISVKQIMQEDDAATIRFSVEDTGIGINENNLERIFTAFEQAEANTARRFGGTGLGLAISSNLVKLMGGTLDVKSEENVGSEFFFTLQFPLAKNETKVLEVQEKEQEEEITFENCRLLVVEDNDLNAEIAQTVLEMVGIETERASNGKEAVDIFEQAESGYFDAILMDIRMPVMDGLEATKCIRTLGKEDSRTVPIIAMTANAFDEDMKKSIDSGMNGHLSKPIDINKLYKVLQEILC